MRKNTGYINSFDVIDINKGAVSFNDIYKEDIVKKINNTYDLYYNKSMDNVPNSTSNVETIANFLNNLTNNYNDLDIESNILNIDELIRLKKIYDLGISPSPDISVTTVSIPTDVINDILDDISRFELIKDSLTDPNKRKFYFQVYSTSNEYTSGEANYDSLIITNSQNLEQMIDDITKTAEDLKNDDLLIYNNLASFPVIGVVGEVYLANDTKIKYEWNGSSYVVSTNTSYFAGANKLNLKLDRELNSKLSTIKADAIEFAVHVANLIKYLYYGIKNPDMGGGGITLDLYNLMKSYFNTKYPQFNLTPFERFNEVPVNQHYIGKSFRKIMLKLYGGTFDVYSIPTGEVEMDSIKYYWRNLLQPLYYGTNVYKSNLSNVISSSIKNSFSLLNNTEKDTLYNQLNVLLRLCNSDVYNSYREVINDGFEINLQGITGDFQSVPKISTPYGKFYYNQSNLVTITLTSDYYNYRSFARTWGSNISPPAVYNAVITNMYASKTNSILNGDLFPLIKGIWNNSSDDNTNRIYGSSLNLKHKCNALYSIMHSTIVSNELNRVNEFNVITLLTTVIKRYTIVGELNNSPSAIGLSSSATTEYINILNALSIPTSIWGSIAVTIPYNDANLSSIKNYDVESAYELEFHGIIP